MKVLWLTPDKPENISVGRRKIADSLAALGIDVTLRGTTAQTMLTSLREWGEYDLLVGTTRAGAIAGAALSILTRTPLVVDHVDPIRQFAETHPRWLALAVRLAENVSFALAAHVLYVYLEEEERVCRYAHAASKTSLGVAYDRFADPDPQVIEHVRARLAEEGISDDTKILIYVGGLEPIYHINDLLAAIEHLNGWTLLILGTGSLKEQVERAADDREDIIFLGTVDHANVPGYLHAATAGICLVDDPHTLKVLEYGATGLPTVQLRGRAEDRFGTYVEYCAPCPQGIACAVRAVSKRRGNETFQEYVQDFDYKWVADHYSRVFQAVARDEIQRLPR